MAEEAVTVEVGAGDTSRTIAVRRMSGRAPVVVWLGGFKSDMTGTKAEALAAWAASHDQGFLRFDYSGHGASGGRFEDGTITRWLEEALAVIEGLGDTPVVLVGSSMGGWIALLVERARRAAGRPTAGLVLIAPAVDFTERLMWDHFPPKVRRAIEREGVWLRPSAYGDEPYPITRALIEDGRRHLLMHAPISVGSPVHVLQGVRDEDVPWSHATRLVELLPDHDVTLTLVKDGDHRLSRPEDISRLIKAVETMVEGWG